MIRALLHIGNPKTGTSAIQSFLSVNRDRLPTLYPPGPGDRKAARRFPTSGNASNFARRLIAGDDPRRVVADMVDQALYSSELFSSVAWTRFAKFLEALDAKIILYVRPQVSAIPSGFAQVSQNNKFTGTLADFYAERSKRFAYSGRYAQLRSECQVVLRPYIRAMLVNRDIVDDFCAAAAFAIPPGAVRPGDVNVRKTPPITPEFAAEIAQRYSADNQRLDELSGSSLGLNEANQNLLRQL